MIIHADMDAFYASVEIRDKPQLAHKPVAVGGSVDGRGVISAANYLARRFGVHSAMPSRTALRLCPGLVLLPGRMAVYAEVSTQIRAIFEQFTPTIEPLSLDEAFLDVSASEKLFGSAKIIGREIKQRVKQQLGLVVSVGIAPNKFIAKIASDVDKPDGFVYVANEDVQAFLDPLPVSRIWGVGKVTEKTLKQLGITTIYHLRSLPQQRLKQRFGEHGLHLWQLANGIDHRAVTTDHEAKSISHETTFAEDIADKDVLLAVLLQLTEQVARRLRRNGLEGRTVQIKVRYSDFKTVTRAHTMGAASNRTDPLWHTAKRLFVNNFPKHLPPLRLLGMGVSGFEKNKTPQQQDLFADATEKQKDIDGLSDSIKEKFGSQSIQRGTVFKKRQ